MEVHIPINKPTPPSTLYTVLYVDNRFYVKVKDRFIPIKKEQTIVNSKTKILYALPTNNRQSLWFKKKFKCPTNARLEKINLFWSTLYAGQKVKGYVKGQGENKVFIVVQ